MRLLMKGNEAVVRGAVAAGCRAYFGYPITPASEIAEMASLLLPDSGGVFVPAESEIVLEGHLTRELGDEGPFLDLTGTRDRVRQQPFFVVDCVTHRRDPLYQALLPGGREHRLLMGMPREPTIYAAVNRVCACCNVHITPGGGNWLHAVVQIDKRSPSDGHAAIHAAFEGHSSLKHVVIVDRDVDLYSTEAVEWAIAARFQADRDLVVLRDQPSSSLDPSALLDAAAVALSGEEWDEALNALESLQECLAGGDTELTQEQAEELARKLEELAAFRREPAALQHPLVRRLQPHQRGIVLDPGIEGPRVTAIEARVNQPAVQRKEVQEDLGQGGEGKGGVLEGAIGIAQRSSHDARPGVRQGRVQP